jgi:hypothetical protein
VSEEAWMSAVEGRARLGLVGHAESAQEPRQRRQLTVFAIARGEAVEAVAAVEIAAHAGDTTQQAAERCVVIGNRLVALLTGFIRR